VRKDLGSCLMVAGSHLFRAAAGTRLLIRGFGHHVPMLLLPTFQNFVIVLFHVISYSLQFESFEPGLTLDSDKRNLPLHDM
jgi:hypothetical protein